MIVLLIVVLSAVGVAAEEAVVAKSITKITPDTFTSITGATRPFNESKETLKGNWFLMLYLPKCSHCIAAMPHWNEFGDKVAERSSSIPAELHVGAIDCKTHKTICTEFVTDGYPTFVLLRKNHTLVRYKWIAGKQNFLGFAESQLKAPEGLGLGLGGKDSDADSANGTSDESAETKADSKTKGSLQGQGEATKANSTPTKKKTGVSSTDANETVITRSWNFIRALTGFQWFELVVILCTAAALLYLLFFVEDQIQFKRLHDHRSQQLRGLGLRDQA